MSLAFPSWTPGPKSAIATLKTLSYLGQTNLPPDKIASARYDAWDLIQAVSFEERYHKYDSIGKVHGETVVMQLIASNEDEIQVAGGRVDKGFAKVKVAVPQFTDIPKQGDKATYLTADEPNYVSGEVLRIVEKVGNLWTLLIGSPAAMDRKQSFIR